MKWIWIGIGLMITALLIGVTFWVFLPGKSVLSKNEETKALKTLLGRNPYLGSQITPATWDVHTNQYIQFRYPSSAKVYTKDNTKAMQDQNVVDSFSFNMPEDHVSAVIQVVISSSVLSEYPAVGLRTLADSGYIQATISANEIQFTKQSDISEQSAFYQKHGKVVSVAVTGYSQQKIASLFSGITASLQIF